MSLIQKTRIFVAGLCAVAGFWGIPAFSADACAPIDRNLSPSSYRVNYFTNYAPIVGGINGSCGKSASGKDACRYFLEDYLSGASNAVMIAIPQYDCPPEGWKWVRPRGAPKYKVSCRSRCPGFYNPDMFGGLYRSREFENSLRQNGIQASCVPLAADDRYAKSESCKSKIDMVTRHAKSRLSGIINSIRSTDMVPIGRSNNIAPPVRRIQRDPNAVAGLDGYVSRPIPRRGRRQIYEQPEMPTKEADDASAAAAAAAATYYTTYEAQRNNAIQEQSRRNTELLNQFHGEKRLNPAQANPGSAIQGQPMQGQATPAQASPAQANPEQTNQNSSTISAPTKEEKP